MKPEVQGRLQQLREDFRMETGAPFLHFMCPILLRDEDVEVCKAHVINQAFSNSSKSWTVQRKDVDNFYGSHFEGPFLDLQYVTSNLTPFDVLFDAKWRSRLSPKLLINDVLTAYFIPKEGVPHGFDVIRQEHRDRIYEIAIKDGLKRWGDANSLTLSVEINRDLRIESFVSVLKAAHLTLFSLLGYRYALSGAGRFLGRHVLGEFYLQNAARRGTEIKSSAKHHFRPYEAMMRPIIASSVPLQGTVSDRVMQVCLRPDGGPWAFLVSVRTSAQVHVVLVPYLDRTYSNEQFIYFSDFLKGDQDYIDTSFIRLSGDGDRWELDKGGHRLNWPRVGTLFPD